MTRASALLEDAIGIRMVLQRLCLAGDRLDVAYKAQRAAFPMLTEDGERLAFRMAFEDIGAWGLKPGENLAIKLKDRGLEYECVVAHAGQEVLEGVETCLASIPRVLRRSDLHRLADFIPDRGAAQNHTATFTNTRNALIDGTVQSFGEEGLELVLRNTKQDIRELLRMGEESLLDVPLDSGLRLRAPTTVAYFGENLVGLRFTKQADAKVLDQYRTWIQDQQVLQAQQDKEEFSPRGFQEATARLNRAAALPSVKVVVDRDPMILLLTEKEDFARRLGEALSRKFGLAMLDHIKGPVKAQLKSITASEEGWGRVRLVLIHNQLRLASPLELCRQLIAQEGCPLPVILAGTEEDEAMKRHHAVAAGAVDYVAVEPFRILAILRKLDETLRLFEGT
jgi:CheY-like chemotaxis protein